MSDVEIKNTCHRWEDVSHHGSPVYMCEFCNIHRSSPDASKPCPKAAERLAKEAKEREEKERSEWEALVRRREREAYLEAKYGKEG